MPTPKADSASAMLVFAAPRHNPGVGIMPVMPRAALQAQHRDAHAAIRCRRHNHRCMAGPRPPFHHERATTYVIAEQIIREAAALLQRHGRLYLVANSFLKYGPVIEQAFGNVEILRKTNRFKVWSATKKR